MSKDDYRFTKAKMASGEVNPKYRRDSCRCRLPAIVRLNLLANPSKYPIYQIF